MKAPAFHEETAEERAFRTRPQQGHSYAGVIVHAGGRESVTTVIYIGLQGNRHVIRAPHDTGNRHKAVRISKKSEAPRFRFHADEKA